MTNQERYEQDNPLYEFPRKPGHALRGEGWAWLDDEVVPGYDVGHCHSDSQYLMIVIACRMARRREEAARSG